MYITEIFHSIQGESTFAGIPTTFLRFAKCNLRCVWCDTPHSFAAGTPMSRTELHAEVAKAGLSHVCLTGGEPLLQPDLPELAQELLDAGYTVSVETGGHMDISVLPEGLHRICDIKTPGAFSKSAKINDNLFEDTEFHEENLKHLTGLDEAKFVVASLGELAWVKEVIERYNLQARVGTIHISPVHGAIDLETLARWMVKNQIPARMSLQIHKYIFGEDAIGV
jgi:7-carboxy-7-deazaguanine synthase